MAFTRTLRIFIALALLSAQQAALAHQIWHTGDPDKRPAQNQLCAHHEALGTVAGALDCPLLPMLDGAPAAFLCRSAAFPVATMPGPAPSSRGPPPPL